MLEWQWDVPGRSGGIASESRRGGHSSMPSPKAELLFPPSAHATELMLTVDAKLASQPGDELKVTSLLWADAKLASPPPDELKLTSSL